MMDDELRPPSTGQQQQQQQHHHHKQATQVTTVTKVVREVKHHIGPAAPGSAAASTIDLAGGHDYVAMPLDVQHLGPDGQPVDYVAMPLGMYPRSQYLNYNNHSMDQGSIGGGVQSYGSSEPQYHHYDYEHYPTADQYSNSTGGGGFMAKGPPNGYLTEFDRQSPCPSDEPSRSQSPHTAAATAAALAAGYHLQSGGYEDMPDYRITPSPGGVGLTVGGGSTDEYRDDATAAAIVYGYASPSPYGAVSGKHIHLISLQLLYIKHFFFNQLLTASDL